MTRATQPPPQPASRSKAWQWAALIVALSLCATYARAAEEVPPPDISPADTWQPRQAGSVRVMNKTDSTVQLVTLKVGETATYESLSLTLSGCFVRPADLPDDAAAHLKIVDSRPNTPGFDGWMLKREPSLNMLQHPVYDVQLAACS